MDVSYYYQILDIGILYEKGGKRGKRWKIGEKKRLGEEILFWMNLLEFIFAEENGFECSDKLFEELETLCKKYKFPNYQRILSKKEELINDNCTFKRNKEEEANICSLMRSLFLEMQKNLYIYKNKEEVYRILIILHNLPKTMHGKNILNENSHLISYHNALSYVKGCMDERRKSEYARYFI